VKLAVITACVYPDRKPIHYLEASCKRQGITLLTHGEGHPFGGWAQTLTSLTLPHMRDLEREGYTHVLFTDGSDSIIVAPEQEIVEKYVGLGSPPCLMSADSECYPPINGEAFTGPEPWRYVNGGGYIAEIPYFVDLMTRLAQKYAGDGNHQSWIVQEWPIEGMKLDTYCRIFQTMDGAQSVRILPGMVVNRVTNTFPCVLHFPGGYSDPETGRDERIYPYWRQLYGE